MVRETSPLLNITFREAGFASIPKAKPRHTQRFGVITSFRIQRVKESVRPSSKMKTSGTEKHCGKRKQGDKEGALRWRENVFL